MTVHPTTGPRLQRGAGIKYGHLLGKLVNRPLLTTPRRALTLFGLMAPRAGIRADDAVSWMEDEAEGPLLLSRLASEASGRPRVLGPRDDGKAYRVQGGIAIIPVTGDLVSDLGTLDPWCGMTGYDGIMAKLDLALDDAAVRGAALLVNSPGGEVTQCAVCADRIRDFQLSKPLRTIYADAGYSAACWLGSQGERVYAPRTGGSGSVGVVTLHADMSEAYADSGMKITVLHAGAHKADGHPFAPLPDDVAADITAELESLRRHFAEAVAGGRGIDINAVLDTEARCLSSEEAQEMGMIDEIMNPDDALAQFIADLADGGTMLFTPAPAGTTAKGVTMASKQPAAKAAKTNPPKANGKAKAPPKANAEIQDEDAADGAEGDGSVCESCPHCDKDRAEPPCRDCPDNPEAEDDSEEGGDQASTSEDVEEDVEDPEDESAASAASATKRIQAILTAPEAQASPNLAQHLAFNSKMPAKSAIAALKQASTDANSGAANTFANAMAANSGAKLGAGGTKATSDGWDAAFAKTNPQPKR